MKNLRSPFAAKALLGGAIYAGAVLCFFLLFEATVTMTPDFQPRFRTAGLILTAAAFIAGCVARLVFQNE
jgi:hypothetical protein